MASWDERHGAEIKRRNDAIDDGVAARNQSIEPKNARIDHALNSYFGPIDRKSAAASTVSTSKSTSAASKGTVSHTSPNTGSTGDGPARLTSFPKAFAAFGNKLNELCEWWHGLKAGPGITITKSKGATIIGVQSGKTGTANPGLTIEEILEELSIRTVTIGNLVVSGSTDLASADITGALTADNATFQSTAAGTLGAASADITGALTADNATITAGITADAATFQTTDAGTLDADSADITGALTADNLTLGGEVVSGEEIETCDDTVTLLKLGA
jgi:hypothetical protein